VEKQGHTTFLGYVSVKTNFSSVIDFRSVKDARESTFNVISNLKGSTLISGARSYLSTGIGQADIRLISYEDLSPYMDDNRLWFTFSCRGVDIFQSAQGVLSVDPSVFDVKFEGMIVCLTTVMDCSATITRHISFMTGKPRNGGLMPAILVGQRTGMDVRAQVGYSNIEAGPSSRILGNEGAAHRDDTCKWT
jgi:hypothetical protein